MTAVARDVVGQSPKGILLGLASLSEKRYRQMTGRKLPIKQREFLYEVIYNLSDIYIKAGIEGLIKPVDLAQGAVNSALRATGINEKKVTSANHLKCRLALVSFALTTVEFYGAALAATATAAAAYSNYWLDLKPEAGVMILEIVWNYMFLDTALRCLGDLQAIRASVPPRPAWNYTPPHA